MKISVCCPSYKRSKVETLDYLPFCKVYVDNKEYDDYIKSNKNFEDNIISVPDGIQGNVSRIRNYILDEEYKKGVDVVCIVDDDLKALYQWCGEKEMPYKKIKIEADEFLDFVEKYSIMCQDFGFKLWGVNINADALSYRQYSPFSTLSVILGPFSCHIRSDIRYDENLPLKEDYDLAIQHLNKYRGILRVNYVHYDCKQSKQEGGCATYRNYDKELEQLKLLQKKWGNKIVKIDNAKNNNQKKESKELDYNPIIRIPIKGI